MLWSCFLWACSQEAVTFLDINNKQTVFGFNLNHLIIVYLIRTLNFVHGLVDPDLYGFLGAITILAMWKNIGIGTSDFVNLNLRDLKETFYVKHLK